MAVKGRTLPSSETDPVHDLDLALDPERDPVPVTLGDPGNQVIQSLIIRRRRGKVPPTSQRRVHLRSLVQTSPSPTNLLQGPD